MDTRLHPIVVWFRWKLRAKTEGNCSGRSRVRRILLTCIQLLLLQFLHVIWSTPTNFSHFPKNRSIIFFINWKIPRTIVNKYTLRVSRTLKTGKLNWTFFNFSRLPFSFELTKKPFLSLDLVPTPTVAILKDCVTSVAILCAVEMRNAIQGNDLK